MRPHVLFLALVMGLTTPWLGGCAKLNQWLEGTAGEEEKKDQEDPAKTFADQSKALAGSDQAKRKEAVGKLIGLATAKPPTDPELAKSCETVRPQALATAIKLLDDENKGVAQAALAGFSGPVGFAEKTEDERQLDPEAYARSLNLKRAVFNDGLPRLLNVLTRPDADLRYSAIIVLTSLAKAPVCAGDAKLTEEQQDQQGRAKLKSQVGIEVAKVAQDTAMTTDVRLLAIEAVVAFAAWEQVGTLSSLLADPDDKIRARVALALAQGAPGLGSAKSTVEANLLSLAKNAKEPEDVRWKATLALGALHSGQGAQLTTPVLPPPSADLKREPDKSDAPGMAPLEAYRTYALANGNAAAEVSRLNQDVGKVATAAEEELAAERKKGYK
ncbi:MAG: HEAT repeat domain-containing protein [Armatimonadetes bacterium]|nr:HEAT repeat domain-containing protein [Armatimonadota bacterium]